MKRTFIAVSVVAGNELKNAIANMKSDLGSENIKWVDISNMHVTLAFLGNTGEAAVKSVSTMLENTFSGFGEVAFSLAGLGVFKSYYDPKVIFAGIENSEKLIEAHNMVRNGLDRIDIRIEDGRFSPHLTIGRIKDLRDKSNFQKVVQQFTGIHFQTVIVNEIVYYESILLPSGPVYKRISGMSLTK
jgi:RNA 2',3'-cyclic 3'-phosphodiesterase